MSSSVTKLRVPEIVSIGNREVISTSQMNVPLVGDFLIRNAVNDWVSVVTLARFIYGAGFAANQARVRKRLWDVRRHLLSRGFFLIHEGGRRIERIKIFVETDSEVERSYAEETLRRMRNKSGISAALYAQAERLVHGNPTT